MYAVVLPADHDEVFAALPPDEVLVVGADEPPPPPSFALDALVAKREFFAFERSP